MSRAVAGPQRRDGGLRRRRSRGGPESERGWGEVAAENEPGNGQEGSEPEQPRTLRCERRESEEKTPTPQCEKERRGPDTQSFMNAVLIPRACMSLRSCVFSTAFM